MTSQPAKGHESREPATDWDRCPTVALLAHIRDTRVAQRAEIERLRGSLPVAEGPGADASFPGWIVDALLRCLRDLSTALVGVEAALEPHLLALEAYNSGTLMPVAVSERLRRMRAARESTLDLLEFARALTGNFAAGEGMGELQRLIYTALGPWCERERACLDLEREVLVPRILAIDPAVRHQAAVVDLPVHHQVILAKGGRRQRSSVFCPADKESVGVEWCRDCPVAQRVTTDAVRCAPGVAVHLPTAVGAHLGADTLVGTAMSRDLLTILPEVPVHELVRALDGATSSAALVVDDGERLVGIVDRERASSVSHGCLARDVALPSPCIGEHATLAEAIDRMVRSHVRFLSVVGAGGRVVGLLSDLDALRQIAAHRRGE